MYIYSSDCAHLWEVIHARSSKYICFVLNWYWKSKLISMAATFSQPFLPESKACFMVGDPQRDRFRVYLAAHLCWPPQAACSLQHSPRRFNNSHRKLTQHVPLIIFGKGKILHASFPPSPPLLNTIFNLPSLPLAFLLCSLPYPLPH